MLRQEDIILLVVDIQGNLAHQMYHKEVLFENTSKIIKGIQAFGIPILHIEQNPEGLGQTIPEISDLLGNAPKITKQSFSCCGEDSFVQILKESGKNLVLISGIEAHVCVYQTAMDLIGSDYEVFVICDAISSRTSENKALALRNMRDEGVGLTSVEMALFELLKKAEGGIFKEIINIVK